MTGSLHPVSPSLVVIFRKAQRCGTLKRSIWMISMVSRIDVDRGSTALGYQLQKGRLVYKDCRGNPTGFGAIDAARLEAEDARIGARLAKHCSCAFLSGNVSPRFSNLNEIGDNFGYPGGNHEPTWVL